MKTTRIIIVLLLIVFTACVDTSIPEQLTKTEKQTPVTPPTNEELGKSVLVKNALLNVELTGGKNCDIKSKQLMFDLDTGKFVTGDKLFSNEWEFDFTPNKFIGINNPVSIFKVCVDNKLEEKKLTGNTLCTLVAKTFDEVTEAPDPKTYLYNISRTVEGKFSENGVDTPPLSRYYYHNQANTNKEALISYCLPKLSSLSDEFDSFIVETIPNRTFIFKTSEGNYAKLQIICIYKDCPKLEEIKNGQKLGLTFRYFVQKDGSRNLKHNE